MFKLYRPVYNHDPIPSAWTEIDHDTDYGELLRRNLISNTSVGAISHGPGVVYVVLINESILKVVYDIL